MSVDAPQGKLGVFAGVQATIGEHAGRLADSANAAVERIIARLDRIADLLQIEEGERNVGTATTTGAGESALVVDPRPGYMSTIEHIAISVSGATDVDIYIGTLQSSGFRARYTFAAAGRQHQVGVTIQVPENSPVFVVSSTAVTVTAVVQVKRERV